MTDREKLIGLIEKVDKEWDVYFNNFSLKRETCSKSIWEFKADHLLANGVMVLPCRVGDTVYRIFPACDKKHRKCWSDYCKQCDKEKAHVRPLIMKDIAEILSLKHLFNKEIFLEKEIAEEKLKEIK